MRTEKWYQTKAAEVTAVLNWGWCFADALAKECGMTRQSLAQVIAYMRNNRVEVYAVGRGDSLAYEFPDRQRTRRTRRTPRQVAARTVYLAAQPPAQTRAVLFCPLLRLKNGCRIVLIQFNERTTNGETNKLRRGGITSRNPSGS